MTSVKPILDRVGDFKKFLGANFADEDFDSLRKAEAVGRPIGSYSFTTNLENASNGP